MLGGCYGQFFNVIEVKDFLLSEAVGYFQSCERFFGAFLNGKVETHLTFKDLEYRGETILWLFAGK